MKKIICFLLAVNLYAGSFAQVNFQSGGATFGLPMFNWKDDKSRLSFDVSLAYNSGFGLKVNDLSSNIGQGWSLSAGGAVSRMQVGQPDDQKPYNGTGLYNDLTKYPAGYLYNPMAASNGCPQSLVKYPIFEWRNQVYKQHNVTTADREQDRFAFNFNGRAGFFVLRKNGGDIGVSFEDNKGLTFQDHPLKIWFVRNESLPGSTINQGIRTTITAFFIQDENGFIYKFDKYELTKTLQVNYCDANLSQSLTQPSLDGGNVYHDAAFDNNNLVNPYVINTWYLSQIKDPLTNRVINITYQTTRDIVANGGTSITYYTEKDYAVISHNFSKTQTPVISAITFPDGHTVTFNYGAERVDLPGDYSLSSIDFTYQGRYLSKYVLNSAYFLLNRVGTPVNAFQKSVARLCLQSIKKYGVDLKDEEPPYKFEYFTGSSNLSLEPSEQTLGLIEDIVPPPFFHIKDVWGYYNGNNSKAYNGTTYVPIHKPLSQLSLSYIKGLCFLRSGSSTVTLNPKAGYAKNGLLKKIIYPTGGTLSYEYEQNVGKINGVTMNVGGVHVLSTSNTDGSVSGKPNDCNNPIVSNYSYNDDLGQSSLWAIEAPVNSQVSYSHYEPEYRKWKWWSPGCKWKYQYPGIISREQAISLTGHQEFLMALSTAMEVFSAIMTVVDIVSVCLKATPAAIIAIVIDIVMAVVGIIISCTSKPSNDATSTAYFNSDRNAENPLPMQFKQVSVTESSGGNGKTVMKFTSEDDYPLWEPTNTGFSMKQRFAHYAYGLPLKTTVLDATGKPVNEKTNVYDFGAAWILEHPNTPPFKDNIYTSCKCDVYKSYSQRNTDWEGQHLLPYQTASNANMGVEYYQNKYGYVLLNSTTEKNYKPGSSTEYNQQTTSYEYTYNTKRLVEHIYTTRSDGNMDHKYIRYNSSFTGGALNTLLQNYIKSIPISTITEITNGFPGQPKVLGETVTELISLPNGDIRPSRTLEQRFSIPLSGTFGYQGPGNAANPPYKETQTFTYDASSNLIGLKDEGNHVVTNIYGYSDKFVIASVINATPVVDKAAYTSFEDGGLGGWSISGSTTVVSTSSVTGTKSLSLPVSAVTISAPLNSAKAYTLSYWSNAGPMSISAGTLVKTSTVLNGYTCYEYLIPAGNATASISSSSARNIDELRLYPQTARMRTVTYDPIIGKTSECDENNRATYYEYDNLGRLKFIKDDSKNVVKMYEYNYASKQNGCTASFTNIKISETFYKNNCAVGYIGAPYTYIIPAGKYTSTVSQEVVDGLVQDELDMLGQAQANTNGTCIRQYGNTARSQSFTKENCPVGYLGTSITYTVPANKYLSIISQADADAQRDADINANGQTWVNATSNSNCTITTTAQWVSTGLAYCEIVSGNYTGNQFTQFIDENPNSSTYNTTYWQNTMQTNTMACSGVAKLNIVYSNNTPTTPRVTFTNLLDDLNYYDANFNSSATNVTAGNIPAGTYNLTISPVGFTGVYTFTYQIGAAAPVSVTGTTVLNLPISANITIVITGRVYSNVLKSQAFTKNNCPSGYISPSVLYTVPQGTYTSTVSQADADNQAQTDVTNNGQSFANTNGVCELPPPVAITGNTSFSIGVPNGSGTITGPAGTTISVNINANGATTGFTLSVSIPGVTITGNTSVTNGYSTFTFVMPASGSVNWSASFSAPSSAGGGSISVN